MVCTVTTLYEQVRRVIADSFVLISAEHIITEYTKGSFDYAEALALLSKIDPHISSYCALHDEMIQPSILTSGVFCQCNQMGSTATVDINPVAGGIGLDYIIEYTKCINALNPQQDYYFSLNGKADNCSYLAPVDTAFWCARALTGDIISCGN